MTGAETGGGLSIFAPYGWGGEAATFNFLPTPPNISALQGAGALAASVVKCIF